MNVTTSVNKEVLSLAYALLVYQVQGSSCDKTFITKHPVSLINNGPVIRPGTPMTEGDYLDLVKSLSNRQRPSINWIESNVLCHSQNRLIWWVPPQSIPLFFDVRAEDGTGVHRSGICPIPGLIFVAEGRDLWLYAVKGDKRPTPETKLYQAPFLNVWADGMLCIGNAPLPAEEQRHNPTTWQDMFFRSRFTHSNIRQPNRLTKGVDPTEFWIRQLDKPSAKFPEKVLVDIKKTAQNLLDLEFQSQFKRLRT